MSLFFNSLLKFNVSSLIYSIDLQALLNTVNNTLFIIYDDD